MSTNLTQGALERYVEVSQFLAHEALLLDEERYAEWLDLFADDAHYWVPGVQNRARRDPQGAVGVDHMAYFDDTLPDLRRRVDRFTSPTAWAEDPPTRHLHVICNIEVTETEDPAELTVRSVFINYRSQGESDQATLYGRREDLLRRGHAGRLLIARRRVLLRHNVLPAKNINTFF